MSLLPLPKTSLQMYMRAGTFAVRPMSIRNSTTLQRIPQLHQQSCPSDFEKLEPESETSSFHQWHALQEHVLDSELFREL